jgi:AsmA protein
MDFSPLIAATGIKRLGIAIVAACVAGAVALGIASLLISPDSARDAVATEIRAVTGLEPLLGGPIKVSFFPSGSVEFGAVAVGGKGQGDPAVTAERLVARLRTLPLLAGRIEISDITLERPLISVDIDGNGNSNWTPLLAALARSLGPGEGRASRGMSFSQINISNGTMVVRDALHDLTETLASLELSLSLPSAGKSFGAVGRFLWRSEVVDGSLSVGDFLAALSGDLSALKVRLAGAPMSIAFDGTTSSSPSLKIDGAMTVDAPSLREAMRWIGDKPLPGGGFGRFSLKAKTNVVGGNIALSGVNLDLDGNAAEGVLSYASTGRRTWQGTLAVDRLDLTPYVSTARLVSNTNSDWDRMPIILDGLTGFDLDLRLSAARVTIGNAKLGRTAVAANLRGGRLAVTIGESQAFNGVITGSLALANSEVGADFKAQMLFANVDLDSSLGDLLGVRRLEGKGQMAVAIEGSGRSVLALTRTLNGTATINAEQGALAGVNVEQLLRRLERRPLSGSGDFRSGRTPYDKLTVDLGISLGVVTVENVTFDGPTVHVGMAGTASIPTRELDLKGTAGLVGGPAEGGPGFELPFVIQGRWDDPIMLPDAQSLIRRSGATAPLLDALRDRKTRDAVRAAIEKLQGGVPRPSAEPAAVPSPGSQ